MPLGLNDEKPWSVPNYLSPIISGKKTGLTFDPVLSAEQIDQLTLVSEQRFDSDAAPFGSRKRMLRKRNGDQEI